MAEGDLVIVRDGEREHTRHSPAFVAILGQPQKVVDLGSKKIYVYRDMKITFNAGKVADVQ